MKYKTGDKVQIKSLEWFEKNCSISLNREYYWYDNESVTKKQCEQYAGTTSTVKYVNVSRKIYPSHANNSYYLQNEISWESWALEDMTKLNIIKILRGNYEIQKRR